MKRIRFLALTGAALLSAGVLTPVRAQNPDDLKRGVTRISLMNGEVSVRRGDSADWVAGVVNAPLLTADQVSTGPNSRAEVQFDSANMLRIGGNAEIHLVQLEDRHLPLEGWHSQHLDARRQGASRTHQPIPAAQSRKQNSQHQGPYHP